MRYPASFLAAMFLICVAAAHLLRAAAGAEIIVSGMPIPLWPSVLAAIACASLGYALLRERSSRGRITPAPREGKARA
jgi:uncharacterized membrane protein YccF (DUF307 family)